MNHRLFPCPCLRYLELASRTQGCLFTTQKYLKHPERLLTSDGWKRRWQQYWAQSMWWYALPTTQEQSAL